VRAVLGTFTQSSKFESDLLEQLYNEEKNNTIVIYVTSVAAVRQRFDECNTMLKVSAVSGLLMLRVRWGERREPLTAFHTQTITPSILCRYSKTIRKKSASRTSLWTLGYALAPVLA
jgi:hypothetical protein